MSIKTFMKSGIQELVIARPDEFKDRVIYKHPDNTIPNKARLTVGSDETALFFRDGQFVGYFEAGLHVLDSSTIPFLGQLVDRLTGGNIFMAELFFVSRLEMTGQKFGGRIGKMRDPESGLAVETMVHGTFGLRITHPHKVVLGLTGLGSQPKGEFVSWFREQVLKVIRDNLAELCVKSDWPLLKVTSGAYTEEIEATVLERVAAHCDDYGVKITRLGNFHVAINESDEKRLEDFYEKAAYIRMTGGLDGYAKFADAEMKMGAAAGLAQAGAGGGGGGGGSSLLDGAGLGIGLAMANQFAAPQSRTDHAAPNLPGQSPQAPGPVQNGHAQTCTGCGAQGSGKFCAECGQKLEAGPKFCSECGCKAPGKFCSECGHAA